MPKKRAVKESSSDSDSGPEDREPAKKVPTPTKKPKKEDKGDEEEHSWQLDKFRWAKVRTFHGRVQVDIREYYEKNTEILPGKKGIALTKTQWEKLKEAMGEIDKALEEVS